MVKKLLERKASGFYVAAATLVLALAFILVYGIRGGNTYSPVSALAVWMFVAGIITNCLILIKDFKFGAYIPFIFYFIGFGVLFNSEMLYISNVFVNVDGNSFDFVYILMFVLLLLTLIGSFAATLMKLEKEENKEAE